MSAPRWPKHGTGGGDVVPPAGAARHRVPVRRGVVFEEDGVVVPIAEQLREAEGGCMEFVGHRTSGGYGGVTRDGRKLRAHRVAWEEANGPIPPGLFVLHRCDNPPCCNPDHLFLGTQQENVADRELKGRGKRLRGDAHPARRRPDWASWCTKLSRSDVLKIRELRAEGVTTVALGRQFGVHSSTISRIARGVWRP